MRKNGFRVCGRRRLLIITGFMLVFLLPLTNMGKSNSDGILNLAPVSASTESDIDEATPWWNVSFHYRRYVNLTDTNSTPRIDVPFDIWVPFENHTCYVDSIRIVDSNNIEVPSQPYNFTYWEDPDYVKGATIFWYANVSADSTATYWIYYSEDKDIEATNYASVVWFVRTTGILSGKFGVNYWSFRGDWYNVTMYNEAGGKMTNGAHRMADDSWNWNWGTSAGSMHWNPDGLGGQGTSSTAPIAGTTFVNEEGPLFINYTTQLPFGSYARLNVTYTFYKWGWVFRIYIKYTGTISGSGRTDEWVWYPYITTRGIEVAEDLTQTYYSNWVASGNKGKPAGFGWWNDNGISHGTVRISHDSWNTNPSYPNNYDNYYYRWWDQGSYEFWDTAIPTIYAISGTILEERCAIAVWNGSIGRNGYTQVFNATSRFLPIIRQMGNVSSYSFRINVKDLGGSNIEGVNVSLLDKDTGEILYKSSGEKCSSLTDVDGNVTFIGLVNKSYRIDAWIDSSEWLKPQTSPSPATGMNATWSDNRTAVGPFTSVAVVLNLASIDIHLEDLMGDDMATVGSETIQVRLYNASDSDNSNWRYMDYQNTDGSGDITFTRVPKCDWIFNFSYSDTDTGHIFQWSDFAEYCSYRIPESDIIGDLLRPDWVLPLVTLKFNMRAYDGVNVPNGYVRISKKGTGDPIAPLETEFYNITHYTDANGNVTFYRVLNGTWHVYFYRADDYGQTASNSTQLDDIQNENFTQLIVPLTCLRVLVIDEEINRVTGAQIDLSANSVHLVTAFTDTTGFHNFTWIKANDSSWIYRIIVSKAGKTTTSIVVYASFNYLYYNEIPLETPEYLKMYTELNCTTSFESWNYGDNRTFVVGWYNRTNTFGSDYEDTPLTNYNSGRLNFTILHRGVVIGEGWWNSTHPTYVSHEVSDSINFTIAIDTLYFKMNASIYPYIIKINATALGYSPTDIYSITIIMSVAYTTSNGILSDTQYWEDGFRSIYSVTTTPSGLNEFNLTNLDYANYTVYDSTVHIPINAISSGSLIHLGNGLYKFSDATLNASDAGTYDVVIWLHKYNYLNHSFTFVGTIEPVTTALEWQIQPGLYTWGDGAKSATLRFQDTVHGSYIDPVDSITIYWINQDTGQTELIDTSATLVYNYDGCYVANGTWKLHAFVTNANCDPDNVLSAEFTVSAVLTEIDSISPTTAVIEWGSEWAEFDFRYELDSTSTGIPGASLLVISWIGEYTFVDNDNGDYHLSLLAVQEAVNSTVTFTLWLANRTKAEGQVTVEVLIPLEISTTEGFSEQDPIQEYWTHQFLLFIVAGDESNNSEYVTGVRVDYEFTAGGLSGTMNENVTGQYYWIEFSASVASPGVYEIDITASRIGCSPASTSIWIEILKTPTVLTRPVPFYPDFYGSNFTLTFEWNETVDDSYIWNADTLSIIVFKGAVTLHTNLTNCNDHQNGTFSFLVNIRALGLTVDSPGAPTFYTIVISATKHGYGNPQDTSVILAISETPTTMTAEPVGTVIWSEMVKINVTLNDTVHTIHVPEIAVVVFQYGIFSKPMNYVGNGRYECQVDTHVWFPANITAYQTTVTYTLPNYVDGQITVNVKVDKLDAEIDQLLPISSSMSIKWSQEFLIRVRLLNVHEGSTPILSGQVTYLWTVFSIQNQLTLNVLNYETIVNASEVPEGTWTLTIQATSQNFTFSDISIFVTVQPVETKLTVQRSLYQVVYGQSGPDIYLNYSINDSTVTIPQIRLTGEDVNVSTLYAGSLLQAYYLAANRWYRLKPEPLDIDSSLIPIDIILVISAELENYSISTVQTILRLIMPTTLSEQESETLNYADVYLLNFTWLTSYNVMGVEDPASISIQLKNGSLVMVNNITGAVYLENGTYQVELDTYSLGMLAVSSTKSTRYSIVITVSKFRYVNVTETYTFDIQQTTTAITISDVAPVTWSHNFTVRVNLTDTVHEKYVWNGAVVTFEYGSYSKIMTSLNNGTFKLEEDSAKVFSSSTLAQAATIRYTIPNYRDGSQTVNILVNPLEASISILEGSSYSGYWNDTFEVRFQVRLDEDSEVIIQGTEVRYYWVGYTAVTGIFAYVSAIYSYEATIDTGEVPAGSRTLRIIVTRQNYTIQDSDIPVSLDPLVATLTAESNVIIAIYNVDTSSEVRLIYSQGGRTLSGATASFVWAGTTRPASFFDDETGEYVFEFDPSADTDLTIPGQVQLNFTVSLQNYTVEETFVILKLLAATDIIGPTIRVEAESEFILKFAYWDETNNLPVGTSANVHYQIGDGAPVSVGSSSFNRTSGFYEITLPASAIGKVSSDPYQIRILAEAGGYQNWTISDNKYVFVYVDPVTIILPIPLIGELIGPIERDTLVLMLLMVGIFMSLVGAAYSVHRWRIPFQIKQVDKAIKSMSKNKTASVEGIKTMGKVISDMLSPGLADLDIEAPTIDVHMEEIGLEEEAGELLGELDALDVLGIEEEGQPKPMEDFESELAAELEEIIEEEPRAEIDESGAEEKLDEIAVEEPEKPEIMEKPDVLGEEIHDEILEEPEKVPKKAEESPEVEVIEPSEPESKSEPDESESIGEDSNEIEAEMQDEIEEGTFEPEVESESETEMKEPTRSDRIAAFPEYIREAFSDSELEELSNEEIDILSTLSEEEFEHFRKRFISKDEPEE